MKLNLTINKLKKAFTLIELLIVIGIMAVIAAGVVALIDPVEKTRQANDANAQAFIGQVSTALQSYAAQQSDGQYPTTAQGLAQLVTTGELQALPALPSGYTYSYSQNAAGVAVVYVNVLSKKYTRGACTASAYWFWSSANGRACGFCNSAPTAATGCNGAAGVNF